MQLTLSSPWWFILLCLSAGFAFAYILYKPQIRHLSQKIMAVLRFISVSMLCFFLLSPVLVQNISTIEKPKILMLMDNSQSITANKDADFYKGEFLAQWRNAQKQLGNDYQVEYLTFDNQAKLSDSISFNQKKTNISEALDYINNTYARQNVGAVVLASDGIYNRGSNPVYKELNDHALMYSIGMGDTSFRKDAILREANTNAIAYLNNQFPLEINIGAHACTNNAAQLTVTSEGKTLYSERISIDREDFFKNTLVNITADKPGTMHLIVAISPVDGEVSLNNNHKDVFIDVIDGREKILLVYAGPHPDIGAIKEAILANKNYEVIAMPSNQVKLSDLGNYSVAILHQLPSRGTSVKDLVTALRNQHIPIWCIVGSQTAVEQLTTVNNLARIDRNQGRFNESQPVFNDQFNSFTLDESSRKTIANYPPLKVPYGVYSASDNTDIMLFQKIGAVQTKTPIWAFSNQDGEKTAFLFGEGFWRWRLIDFAENESHFASNELVSKTIQYLAVKEDKRKFRVYPTKNVYEEDEPVRFIAELYNASYELVNEADVKLSLKNSANKVYNYTFSKAGKSYQLDIGVIPPGAYQFNSTIDGMPDKVSGKVLITPLQSELVNTKADFGLLRDLAHRHQGEFFKARQLTQALDAVKKNTAISSVSFNEKKLDELINIKWVFFILLALLTTEWFMRKYEGGY